MTENVDDEQEALRVVLMGHLRDEAPSTGHDKFSRLLRHISETDGVELSMAYGSLDADDFEDVEAAVKEVCPEPPEPPEGLFDDEEAEDASDGGGADAEQITRHFDTFSHTREQLNEEIEPCIITAPEAGSGGGGADAEQGNDGREPPAFQISYECKNCGHVWGETYHAGTTVQRSRPFGLWEQSQTHSEKVTCPTCRVDDHVSVQEREPL